MGIILVGKDVVRLDVHYISERAFYQIPTRL